MSIYMSEQEGRDLVQRNAWVAGPAGGNQGATGVAGTGSSNNAFSSPPVSGALGVIGLAAGPAWYKYDFRKNMYEIKDGAR